MYDSIKDVLKADNVLCGAKQVKRAINEGMTEKVYLASDTDENMKTQILADAEKLCIPVVWVASSYMLGKMCGIDVGCSVAAVVDRLKGSNRDIPV